MQNQNLTRLDRLEFKIGRTALLQGQAIMVDGKIHVSGWGDRAATLTGIYDEAEYEALVKREDVMIVYCHVREKVA